MSNGQEMRERGLAFLHRTQPDIDPRCVKVSKWFPVEEAWADGPVWWFDIQVERVESGECPDIHLLCESFHHLCIPTAFFSENRAKIVVADNRRAMRYRLHLSAREEDRFMNVRGEGRVDFACWVVSEG